MSFRQFDFGLNGDLTGVNPSAYGRGLGILLLDDTYPFFPGDVRNPGAWDFPTKYEIAEGVDYRSLVWERDKTRCREPIIRAAKNLERAGCRAVVAECGYFAYFQRDVTEAIEIPAFMSSLSQVPLIQRAIGPNKEVGIVCSETKFLTDVHLSNVGVDLGSNYRITGFGDERGGAEFVKKWVRGKRPDLIEYGLAERDMIRLCQEFKAKYPAIGAIMLERASLHTFAKAIQRELNLPVWSWGNFLDRAWSVVTFLDYHGRG
ncbi:MAG: aspartate/glutamate racemase family protein [Deltaproteobacteria bacterium]|jgi:hypothetical protein|nr:aspartate/glutamate racemase family protein [Deltaproteobacteria bacterium]